MMLTYIIKITVLFYPDDGRYYYLRNVGTCLPNCMALHTTRQYFGWRRCWKLL